MTRIAAALGAVAVLSTACGPDWDRLDPSLGHGGAGTSSSVTGGAGPSTGSGSCSDLDDGEACTKDTCVDGMAIHTPVAAGDACPTNPGQVCSENGQCVECVEDADCSGPGNDCSSGASCNSKKHTCFGGQNVPAGTACNGGAGVCNGSGQCVGCLVDADCTAPDTCGGAGMPNVCGCAETQTCQTLGLTCGMGVGTCGAAIACNDGVKNGAETDVDCGGGMGCATKCATGDECDANADCTDDHCADGLCCATACSAVCMACDVLGNEGNCAPVPMGQSDVGCTLTMACNGNGQCKKANGQACMTDADCASGDCGSALTCV